VISVLSVVKSGANLRETVVSTYVPSLSPLPRGDGIGSWIPRLGQTAR
jgi:hypothetical protein